MAVAATILTLGVSTTLAASDTHNDIQVSNSSSDEYFPTPATIAATHTHTHHYNMKLMSSGSANPTSTNDSNNGKRLNQDIVIESD
jgi:hypothetical protein